MKIRNRNTYFTTLPEGSAPEKKSKKISTTLYFCFLISIALYVLFYVGFKLVYIDRKGVVEVGRHLISSRVEGTIVAMPIRKGGLVDRSQVLIQIRPSFVKTLSSKNRSVIMQNGFTDNVELTLSGIPPAASEKILKLDNEIRMTGIELKMARENYTLLKAQKSQLIDEAFRDSLLELDTHSKRNTGMDNTIHKAALKIKTLKAVKQSLQKYRAAILKNARNDLRLKSAETGKTSDYFGPDMPVPQNSVPVLTGFDGLITSPVKGVVQTVFKEAGAQVFPGDALLALRQVNGKTAVHAFFKPDQIASIKKGKKVKITFPDNSESTGVMGEHYAIAASYKETLREDYIPVRSEILVEIFPVDTADEETWLTYDRMTVTVRVRK